MQCYSCEHYQVTQRRADSKFTCKLCGSRQSVRSIPARSNNAAKLRPLVQRANMARGDAQFLFDQLPQSQSDSDPDQASSAEQDEQSAPTPSRWTTYVHALKAETFAPATRARDTTHEIDSNVVTSLPDRQKKRRRRETSSQDNNGPDASQPDTTKQEMSTRSYLCKHDSLYSHEEFSTQFAEPAEPVLESVKNSHDANSNANEAGEKNDSNHVDGWGSQWGADGEDAWN